MLRTEGHTQLSTVLASMLPWCGVSELLLIGQNCTICMTQKLLSYSPEARLLGGGGTLRGVCGGGCCVLRPGSGDSEDPCRLTRIRISPELGQSPQDKRSSRPSVVPTELHVSPQAGAVPQGAVPECRPRGERWQGVSLQTQDLLAHCSMAWSGIAPCSGMGHSQVQVIGQGHLVALGCRWYSRAWLPGLE